MANTVLQLVLRIGIIFEWHALNYVGKIVIKKNVYNENWCVGGEISEWGK